MITAIARRLGALLGLGAIAVGLHVAPIAIENPAHLHSWVTAADDPILVVAYLAKLAAIAVCGWLMIVTVVDILAMALNLHPLARLTTKLAPAAWRSLVLRPVAAATLVLPPVVLPVVHAVPAVALESPVDQDPGQPPTTDQPELEMVAYSADGPGATLTMTIAVDQPPLDPPASDSSHHVVVGGENLWSIASDHLAVQLDREPTSREITRYWRELIAANQASLPDQANPDLIFPGIELKLPAVQRTAG